MAVPKGTVWKIEPHTLTKHLILRQYLNAWLPMMSTYHGRIVFIDGFAGPGRYKDGELGSPIIVLTTLLNHRYFQQPRGDREFVFVFIEKDKPRAQALEAELARLAKERTIPDWVKYGVEQDKFGDVVTRALDDLERKGNKLAPTLLFVDPFGFSDAPLEVIARVTKNPNCECLITFMFDSIRRWLPHRDVTIAAHFDLLFGTNDWRTLLDEPARRRRAGILTLYRNQLMSRAGLKYVRTFEMLNNRNRPIYSLFFGTTHKEGLSKMKEAMWKADPGAGRVFSDRTASGQTVLFQPLPDFALLTRLLQKRFRGRGWMSINDVMDFVLVDTPFCEKLHLKRRTLAPMEEADPPLMEVRRPRGARNRAGDYPQGTLVQVL